MIENRAATILQPDLGRSGGILETKKIASMAEAYHIQVAPHCYCGPIVGAANIQLASDPAELPHPRVAEAVGRLPRAALEEEDRMAGRTRHPVKGAGSRRQLDEAVCEAHPYDGAALHLQMAQQPLFPDLRSRIVRDHCPSIDRCENRGFGRPRESVPIDFIRRARRFAHALRVSAPGRMSKVAGIRPGASPSISTRAPLITGSPSGSTVTCRPRRMVTAA